LGRGILAPGRGVHGEGIWRTTGMGRSKPGGRVRNGVWQKKNINDPRMQLEQNVEKYFYLRKKSREAVLKTGAASDRE